MPMGAGGTSGLNCHASPPSPSGTTFGTLSWNFRGTYSFQRCGGSRMCESAEMRWYSRAMQGRPPAPAIQTNVRSFQAGRISARREPERAELVGAPGRVLAEEVLIELRRGHGRAGEHRMHLSAVMDLMLEEVREHVGDPLGMPRAGLALEDDLGVGRRVRH